MVIFVLTKNVFILLNFPTSDAPKHIKIFESQKHPDAPGMNYINLSCSTECYPPVTKYLWYKKEKSTKTDQIMHQGQNHTVYSNQPGVYYCVARNKMGEKQSDPVHLFDGE